MSKRQDVIQVITVIFSYLVIPSCDDELLLMLSQFGLLTLTLEGKI